MGRRGVGTESARRTVGRDRRTRAGAELQLLLAAAPRLELAYQHYTSSRRLSEALQQDVAARFTRAGSAPDPQAITSLVIDFLDRAAEARNLPRFAVSR